MSAKASIHAGATVHQVSRKQTMSSNSTDSRSRTPLLPLRWLALILSDSTVSGLPPTLRPSTGSHSRHICSGFRRGFAGEEYVRKRLTQSLHQSSGHPFIPVVQRQRYGDQRERGVTERTPEINDPMQGNI